MADQRVAGLIQLKINGEIRDAKGEFTYYLGAPMRSDVIGADGVHGFTEEPKAPFIEGAITDRGTLDVDSLQRGKDLTVSLDLANGKMIVLRDAWYSGDGTASTKEGEIKVKWTGKSAKEVS
jgi:hypothetical protein